MMLERRNGKMSVCVCHAVVVMNERFRERVNRYRLHHTQKNIWRKVTDLLFKLVGRWEYVSNVYTKGGYNVYI
jgi:hypothetical protein